MKVIITVIVSIAGVILLLSVLLVAWLAGPSLGRTVIWLLVTLAIAYFVGRKTADKQARLGMQAGVVALLFILPFATLVVGDYYAQKPTALNAQCSEVSKTVMAIQPKAPTLTDGFLVAMDYDGISNFRRIKEIPSHPGLDILSASTFDEMAQIALLNWKYSFIEFEMKLRSKTDPMFPGEYSNRGHLNTQGWSGDRYRLYYLAPKGHPNCILKFNFDSVPVRSDHGAPSVRPATSSEVGQIPNTPPPQPEFCLALEITTAPISKYKLTATDALTSISTVLHLQGLDFYTSVDVRSDAVEIIGGDPSRPLAKYDGFHAIVDGKSVSNCGNSAGVKNLLHSTLTPDYARPYYKAKDWYADSAVQRYFEISHDESVPIREPFADRRKNRDPSIPVTYEGKRCVEFRDTVESKFARWIEMAEQGPGCTQIDNIKVTCEYRKGHGPQETWTWQLCGRPGGKSTSDTSYDPRLHGGLDMESIPEYKEQHGKAR